ncbi:MAG TPA: hypothetical protein VMK31_04675 [Sphingomicrobium sp.]|nr:hypothetical protein [Sphingomicrobium sp.]
MIELYRGIFWAALIFALVMAVVPQPPELPGNPSDKLQHIVAFATLAALASAGHPSTSLIKLLAGLSAFAGLIELIQMAPRLGRDADPVDWLAGTIGASLVLAVVWWRRGNQETETSR